MNLTKELKEFKREFKENVSDDVLSKMQDGHDELAKKKVGEKAVKVDQTFPDFNLPSINGDQVSGKSLLGDSRFLIVSFYRGGWCPYCQRELEAINESLEEFKKLGAATVAITPETPDNAKQTQSKHAPDLTILFDDNCEFAEKVGLAFELPETLKETYKQDLDIDVEEYNGNFRLPVPATYVMDANMKVIKRHLDIDYKERLDPSEIISHLKEKTIQ